MTFSFGFVSAVFMASSVKKRVLPHPQGPSKMTLGWEKICLCFGVGKHQALMLSRDPASSRALLTAEIMLPVTGSVTAGAENSKY